MALTFDCPDVMMMCNWPHCIINNELKQIFNKKLLYIILVIYLAIQIKIKTICKCC